MLEQESEPHLLRLPLYGLMGNSGGALSFCFLPKMSGLPVQDLFFGFVHGEHQKSLIQAPGCMRSLRPLILQLNKGMRQGNPCMTAQGCEGQ